jgi:sugar transferase (PEP-CTERM/EpsH1 system associated)
MKLFVMLSRFPYPLEKGDKLRAFHQIRCLSKSHEIHLCALNDVRLTEQDINALKPFCKSINVIPLSRISILRGLLYAFFSGKPLQVGYFYNRKAFKKIQALIQRVQPDHIYCQLIRVSEYVKHLPIKKTLDYQDVFSKGAERRARTSPFYMKPILFSEYRRLLRYEKDIFQFFDHKTIISVPDRDLIPHPEKDRIKVVINGVDTDFFTPMPVNKTTDIVFTGNMGYPPNVNAAEYLVRDILPLVHQKRKEVRVLLAGASPHAQVLALKNEHVHVTGWVDDIRTAYTSARLFIAPMRIGTGLQNKLLEAMAMKIPAITTPLANQALGARAGQEILVGNTARELASHILQILEDEDLARTLSENGHQFIHKNYNWEAATRELEELIIKK